MLVKLYLWPEILGIDLENKFNIIQKHGHLQFLELVLKIYLPSFKEQRMYIIDEFTIYFKYNILRSPFKGHLSNPLNKECSFSNIFLQHQKLLSIKDTALR